MNKNENIYKTPTRFINFLATVCIFAHRTHTHTHAQRAASLANLFINISIWKKIIVLFDSKTKKKFNLIRIAMHKL